MDLLEPLSRTFDHTTKVFGNVAADDLGAPTPCTEWDVRALARHLIGVVTNMGRGARGEALLADLDATPLGPDLAAQFRAEADGTLAAWTGRGLDGTVDIGAGPMPVVAALSVNLLDTATHAWDLARATGQDAQLPDDLAATVFAVSQQVVSDDIRAVAGFHDPVPVDDAASATDKLVAFLGRQP